MPESDPLRSDAVVAAELALGVLEGAELIEARERQIADPDFARTVALWRDHFAVLALQARDVIPPDALEQRVAEAIRTDSRGSVVALPVRSRRASWWPIAAVLSGGLAAALTAVMILSPATRQPSSGPVLVAALDVVATHKTLVARLDAARHLRIAGVIEVPGAHSAQAWLILGKEPPRSLGVLQRGAQQLQTDSVVTNAVVPGATLAISIEPLDGSPTGLPTGPVVAAGTIQSI